MEKFKNGQRPPLVDWKVVAIVMAVLVAIALTFNGYGALVAFISIVLGVLALIGFIVR